MAYGTVKVDTIIFDQGGADQNVTVSGIYRAITSGVTVSGTISGAVLIGTTTVSGATVTGTQSSFTSGNFVTLSGVTATFTSGVIASGTAAAPSLSIVSDPNTGLYSPGADQVALATAGTGRLFVDSSGRVGIGTPSDGSKLLVYGEGTTANTLSVVNPSVTNGAVLYFGDANQASAIKTIPYSATHDLGFFVAGASTERMRISSSGRVGIGTSSPNARLEVSAPSAGRAYSSSVLDFSNIHLDGITNNTTTSALTFAAGGGGGAAVAFSRGSSSDTQISFWTNLAGGANVAIQRMVIDSSGRVGIGTDAPGVPLEVAAASSAGASTVARFRHDNGADQHYFEVSVNPDTDTVKLISTGSANGSLVLGTQAVDTLTTTSAGNVGIGTSTPTENLTIYGTGSRLAVTGPASGSAILLGNQNSGGVNNPAVIFAANGELYFGGGNSWSGGGTLDYNMFISDSGNVGIGTTTPGVKVEINDPGTGLRFTNAASGNFSLGLLGGTSSNEAYIFQRANGPLILGTNNTERMRIDSSGRVGIGLTSPGANLHVNNNGALASVPAIGSLGGLFNATVGINAYGLISGALNSGAYFFQAQTTNGTSATYSILLNPNGGNVGIGTSEPAELLELSATTDPKIRFVDVGNVEGKIGISSSTALTFEFNGSERARIDSSGNVGIGTSSPNTRLHVYSGSLKIQSGVNASVESELTLSNQFRTGRIISSYTNPVNITETYIAFHTNRSGEPNDTVGEVMRIAGGSVGIGTSAPGANHVVEIVGNRKYVSIYPNTGSEAGALGTVNPSSSSGLFFGWNRSNGEGESNIVYGVGAGGSPHLQIASWNGTTYTERLRIDSSGRLLVGSSSARSLYGQTGVLQTEGLGYASSGINLILNNASTAGPLLMLGKSRGSTIGSNTIVQNGDTLGSIYFCGADGSDLDTPGGGIYCEVDGTPGTNDMPGRLVFSTTADGAASPTERMRIGNDGRVFIGCAGSPSASVFGILLSNDLLNEGSKSSVNTTSSNVHWVFFNPNGAVGSISTNGSATAYNTSSDYRLKENVTPFTDGITRLQQLKPSRFNFIVDPDHTVDGFIAHEVQDIVPEAITGEKDAEDDDGNPVYQGIDQSKMLPLVVAALQECVKRIESLESELALLKTKPYLGN